MSPLTTLVAGVPGAAENTGGTFQSGAFEFTSEFSLAMALMDVWNGIPA